MKKREKSAESQLDAAAQSDAEAHSSASDQPREREVAAHDARGLFFDDARFAALARIARADAPCAPRDFAALGVDADGERLPVDAEVTAAARLLAELRDEHLRVLAARREATGGSAEPRKDGD